MLFYIFAYVCVCVCVCVCVLLDVLTLCHTMASFDVCYRFFLKSILSDIRITMPLFFLFSFLSNTFIYPLTLSLCVSWKLKWVSCRQHILGSFFFLSICVFLLVNPLSLHLDWVLIVRADSCHLSDCFLVVFCLHWFPFPLFLPTFVNWWLFIGVFFPLSIFLASTLDFYCGYYEAYIKILIPKTVCLVLIATCPY